MIDMLVLRCDFKDSVLLKIDELGLPLAASITPEGEVCGLRHVWEKIPSSFTDVAFRLFEISELRGAFVELKASPAKVMQGQNIYGSDDLRSCAMAIIDVFFAKYPWVFDLLDQRSWEVASVDVTYATWAESEFQAKAFVRSLSAVSKGQTKCRRGYDTTAYFGKQNSRIKKIKIYAKLSEVMAWIEQTQRKGDKEKLLQHYPVRLLQWASGMIRWEVSLRARWFERRGISTRLMDLVKVFDANKYWLEGTKDLREALEGQEMKVIRDENVHANLRKAFPFSRSGKPSTAQADAAYRTFRAIKSDGWHEVRELMSRRTFDRHVEMLHSCGLSRAYLQGLHVGGAEVIPLLRYAVVEFRKQVPDWAKVA